MGRFLSNDSVFGQIMNRIWILFAANIMFVFFSVPVVTAGPALIALYYVCLKVLRGDRELSPIKTFWRGFCDNLKQGIIVWLIYLGISLLAFLDYRFLQQMEGGQILKFAVAAVWIAVTLVLLCLLPVIAAFADTLPHLLRNAIFFAFKNPLRLIAMAACWGIPLAVTWLDTVNQPLYAFIWFFLGFAIVVMACSSLLVKDFAKYLPPAVGEHGGTLEETPEGAEAGAAPAENRKSDKKTLEEMKKLKM